MKKYKNLLIIGVVGAAFILFFIFYYLPYANRQNKTNKIADSLETSPQFHDPIKQVPEFNFVNQNGNMISNETVKGKVYIADFFYTSCKSACPVLSSQLTRVQNLIDPAKPFKIVSYSLDPENDSVPVLKNFSRQYKANDTVWYFLTGNKKEIYKLGIDGYLQSIINDTTAVINHSQRFILVDQQGMIRGFYNGFDSSEVSNMLNDINYLIYKGKGS